MSEVEGGLAHPLFHSHPLLLASTASPLHHLARIIGRAQEAEACNCVPTPRIAYDELRVIYPDMLVGTELQNRWGVHPKRVLSERTVAALWAHFARKDDEQITWRRRSVG